MNECISCQSNLGVREAVTGPLLKLDLLAKHNAIDRTVLYVLISLI